MGASFISFPALLASEIPPDRNNDIDDGTRKRQYVTQGTRL